MNEPLKAPMIEHLRNKRKSAERGHILYTTNDIIEILAFWEREGTDATVDRFCVYAHQLYAWRRKFESDGNPTIFDKPEETSPMQEPTKETPMSNGTPQKAGGTTADGKPRQRAHITKEMRYRMAEAYHNTKREPADLIGIAKRFGVSASSVKKAHQKYFKGTSAGNKRPRITPELKRQVVAYAYTHGAMAAAEHFAVSDSSVSRWRNDPRFAPRAEPKKAEPKKAATKAPVKAKPKRRRRRKATAKPVAAPVNVVVVDILEQLEEQRLQFWRIARLAIAWDLVASVLIVAAIASLYLNR